MSHRVVGPARGHLARAGGCASVSTPSDRVGCLQCSASFPFKFQVDTGSRSGLTLTDPFAKVHKLRAANPEGVVAVDGWGVGGAAHGYVTRGKLPTIGSVRIPGVVTSLSPQKKAAFAAPSYQGNIGGAILKRFVSPSTMPIT